MLLLSIRHGCVDYRRSEFLEANLAIRQIDAINQGVNMVGRMEDRDKANGAP